MWRIYSGAQIDLEQPIFASLSHLSIMLVCTSPPQSKGSSQLVAKACCLTIVCLPREKAGTNTSHTNKPKK